MKQKIVLALALVIAYASGGSQLTLAQSTGSPVNSMGQASVRGQPYVKTHKRHHKNFYGKHYNVEKHSKQ
ncbi:hypothetical protein [Acidisoma sp.]|uniref:hypothetical protein n=1 Tax=Acidisoma sp. TaxID=1872115 RepID=UPI003B00983F